MKLGVEPSMWLNPIAWPEPFGLAMLESLATGTPVVGTPLGAAPEIVDDGVTGFLRADLRHLVDALHAVGDLDREACRAAVEERFTAEHAVHAVLFTLGYLLDAPSAQELVAQCIAAGLSPADPKLELLHLNAALKPETPT